MFSVAYMMYKLGWINWMRLIVWLVIGLVVYFSYSRHQAQRRGPRQASLTKFRPAAKRR